VKKSLSTRLMYSYMGLIVIIIIGISVGLSYLITDYFFRTKETELNQKGGEVALIVRYLNGSGASSAMLSQYLTSVDQLIGARIWVFDSNYRLINASETMRDREKDLRAAHETTNAGANDPSTFRKESSVEAIDQQLREGGPLNDKVKSILPSVYERNRVNARLFHPYYKEQVLLVGLPMEDSHQDITGAILLAAPIDGLNRVLRDIYIYTIIVGIAALVISVIIVSGLTRRLVRPLVDMKNSAKAIASGDYSLKVVVDGEDEVADLGRSLNSLGRDLEQFVLKTNKMEKLRRDFVANVSHELRMPITIIQGYNQAILDGTVTDPEDIKKYRKLIDNETQRLERLINELLEISRLQRKENEEMEPVPLGEITENVVSMMEVRAKKRDIRLERYIDDNLMVMGNGDRLFRLVMILGDNAMKYSPDSSSIVFQVLPSRSGGAVLTVTDHGFGIPKEDLPYIWERFYKVDKSHSRHIPGTGLGLAIAKEIIRIHKAKVQVQSEVGKGTTFMITFPPTKMKSKMGKEHVAEVVEPVVPLSDEDPVEPVVPLSDEDPVEPEGK
jgi:signal transduction histidine kinase